MSRLLPDLDPDTGITRDEVALFFDREDADAGMRKYSEATKEIPVSERTDPETGVYEYRLGDIENVVLDWRGERRATNRRKPRTGNIAPPEIRAGGKVIFSDDQTPDAILLSDEGGKGEGVKAITVAHAAEQAGISEGDLTDRLVGRARLKVVDGQLVVPLSDLRELAEGGSIPKAAKQATTEPTPDPLVAPTDAAAERRTASMGAALGIDAAAPTLAESVAQAGIQTFSAEDRPPRRLGEPRRWSQS